jgi:hypothetical protein
MMVDVKQDQNTWNTIPESEMNSETVQNNNKLNNNRKRTTGGEQL